MTRKLAYWAALAVLGPFIGLGTWMLVCGFFLAGTSIRAVESLNAARP